MCVKNISIDYNNKGDLINEVSGLWQIVNALNFNILTILMTNGTDNHLVNSFMNMIHNNLIETHVYNDNWKYLDFIKQNSVSSTQTISFIFFEPTEKILNELQMKNLGHRLNLYIYYWGYTGLPNIVSKVIEEPLRVAIITRPHSQRFNVFYNQISPYQESIFKLVNWYDDTLGLYKTPLLPAAEDIYRNFKGRVFNVPVTHSPPWFFLEHCNDCVNDKNNNFDFVNGTEHSCLKVVGGRDHQLLKVMSQYMNFKFIYISPKENFGNKSTTMEKSINFTGGLGIIQNKQGHFLLGEITLSWERKRIVEFSFFTLADSGAFATHNPKRLSETLALIRPFKYDVWPFLILTIIFSGPIIFFIICIPNLWKKNNFFQFKNSSIYYQTYINEITLISKRKIRLDKTEKPLNKSKLFQKCIWFMIQLFLKQSCVEPSNTYRFRFLALIYWLAAAYVLADVYSAKLTSQLAKPAREIPVDNLEKLENAIKFRGYKLFIEKDDSLQEMLQNSTEIFKRLYKLMKKNELNLGKKRFIVESVEKGIRMVSQNPERVLLAGWEALYFNIKRYGIKNVQLSHKLYTKYSAIALQIGCPFLEVFNDMLMRLFEGGILEKITSREYEKLSVLQDLTKLGKENNEQKPSSSNANTRNETDTQPINIRMLQGAFILLFFGYTISSFVFFLENQEVNFNKRSNI